MSQNLLYRWFCRYSGASTSANELSQQWAVRPSTAHRLEIRRALYLHHSNNKTLREVAAHLLPLTKSSNKATLALHSFSKCSFTLSKLRFFELRAPKISACYTTSRLLVTGFPVGSNLAERKYLHHSNNKMVTRQRVTFSNVARSAIG